MAKVNFYESLKNPKLFGSDVKTVEILQTHISYVVLTGKYAYKIKKPVNFGFLDFSTVEKRKRFCEEELRLNRRLCPDVYLDVLPITEKNNNLKIDGDGKVIDYAVKMKEFPQNKIMTKVLLKGKLNEEVIEKICDILNDFYRKSKRSKDIDTYGTVESVKKNTDENFEQTIKVIDVTIPKEKFVYIQLCTNKFLEQKKDLFEKRIQQGHIRDCHGALHSGNIVISDDKIYIFDCIEFNKRFRYSDVASDIGFLSMDLDYQGYPYLSSYLIQQYIEKSKDSAISEILNFYKCYRAYVRGKVIGFKLDDKNIDNKEKQDIKNKAIKYFDLAYYYSALFSRSFYKTKPLLFITSGLTGTGKTTVAKKISVDYNAHLISSDSVRKEIEGIDKFQRHHDAYNTGLYSPEKMLHTYEKVLEKANIFLKNGENVVLDATFKSKELRDMAREIAKKNNAVFIILYCNCPEKIVKKYLDNRIKKKSISDGRWEIYLKQKNSFEQFSDEDFVEIDISKGSYDYQMSVFNEILKKAIEG